MTFETMGGTIPGVFNTILKQNHVMIAGETGSGKSVLLNGLIYNLLRSYKADLVLCDPKKVELSVYKDMPQVLGYTDTLESIKASLDAVHKYMMERYDEMQKNQERLYSGDDLYVIIDEIADLILYDKKGEIQNVLQSILQLGRAAKIHCILATQCPSRKVLNAKLMANITCKVALHCSSAIESRQIIGEAGAEDLPIGKCYIKAPCAFYEDPIPMYTDEEIKEVLDYYNAQFPGGIQKYRKNTKNYASSGDDISMFDKIVCVGFMIISAPIVISFVAAFFECLF